MYASSGRRSEAHTNVVPTHVPLGDELLPFSVFDALGDAV